MFAKRQTSFSTWRLLSTSKVAKLSKCPWPYQGVNVSGSCGGNECWLNMESQIYDSRRLLTCMTTLMQWHVAAEICKGLGDRSHSCTQMNGDTVYTVIHVTNSAVENDLIWQINIDTVYIVSVTVTSWVYSWVELEILSYVQLFWCSIAVHRLKVTLFTLWSMSLTERSRMTWFDK